MNLAELRNKRKRLLDQARALSDKAGAENRSLTDDEGVQFDDLMKQAAALKVEIERGERLEEAEGASKPGAASRGADTRQRARTADNPAAITARYIRTGDPYAGREMNDAAIEEQRASNNTGMNITTPADGGYAVPTGHYQGIIARRDEAMLATRLGVMDIPGQGTTVNVPLDAEADGEFVQTGEQNDANTTNFDRDAPATGVAAMTLVKYSKKLEITHELLEDEDSRLMSFIEGWIGRGMAKTHNQLLLTEVLANGTAALTLDAAAAIGAAEVPELVYLLPEEYEDGAAWVMRRATAGRIRGLVGDNFQFAPTPGGARRELWGFPQYTSQYAGGVQASGKSLVFGNFSFVGKREAPSLTLLNDPYTVDGKILLKYYFRAVYKVLQAEAIVVATHPA